MPDDHLLPALNQPDATALGFPRINRRRELKGALEAYWRQEIDAIELAARAQAIRAQAPGAHRSGLADGRLGADTFTSSLHVAVEVRDEVVLVRLAGPLDIYTVQEFRRDVDPYARARDQIVVDLSEVDLMDSSGLSALLSLSNRAHREGPGPLGLVCPQRHLLRVFEVTGLWGAFSFWPTTAAASPTRGPTRGIAARSSADAVAGLVEGEPRPAGRLRLAARDRACPG